MLGVGNWLEQSALLVVSGVLNVTPTLASLSRHNIELQLGRLFNTDLQTVTAILCSLTVPPAGASISLA